LVKKDTFLEVQKPTMQEGTKSVHGIATSDAISPVQIDSHGKSGGNQIPTKYSAYPQLQYINEFEVVFFTDL